MESAFLQMSLNVGNMRRKATDLLVIVTMQYIL